MKNWKNKFVAISLGLATTLSVGLVATGNTAYAATASTSVSNQVISTAKQYVGTPYHFGSKSGNTQTFDCSSFTQYVFAQNGIHIPRDSRQQSHAGVNVSRNDLQPGDLVFFYSPIHHVGIYIGNGKFIHTYGAPGVTISNLNSGWWSKHFTTARRVF
ncbi:MAG TPA: C40 family peptidase [Bacillota bacterium]|nr:C40 family peptidase [Bacillota bacterium]